MKLTEVIDAMALVRSQFEKRQNWVFNFTRSDEIPEKPAKKKRKAIEKAARSPSTTIVPVPDNEENGDQIAEVPIKDGKKQVSPAAVTLTPGKKLESSGNEHILIYLFIYLFSECHCVYFLHKNIKEKYN